MVTRLLTSPRIKAPKRKVVVLVHGMGLPRRNDMLLTCVNAVASWMDRNKKDWPHGHQHVQLTETRHYKDDKQKEPISSSIVLSAADQEWKIVEAYWADSFDPPRFNPMIGWTINRLIRQLFLLIRRLVVDGLVPFFLLMFFAFLWLPVQLVFTIIALPVLFLIAVAKTVFGIYALALVRPDTLWRALLAGALVLGAIAVFVLQVLLREGDIGSKLFASLGWTIVYVISAPIVYRLTSTLIRPTGERTQSSSSSGRHEGEQSNTDLAPVSAEEQGQRPRMPGRARVLIAGSREGLGQSVERAGQATQRVLDLGLVPMLLAWLVFLRLQAWLYRHVDERLIIEFISRNSRTEQSRTIRSWLELLWTTVLLVALQGFHAINAMATIPLYVAGIVLMFPAMFLVWLLSFAAGVPRVGDLVDFITGRIDAFLVGSLGDIRVFMDEPAQAQRIRLVLETELKEARKNTRFRTKEIYVVSHSTGAAIAYETLVLENSLNHENPAAKPVVALITLGSIHRMARSMPLRRSTFGTRDNEIWLVSAVRRVRRWIKWLRHGSAAQMIVAVEGFKTWAGVSPWIRMRTVFEHLDRWARHKDNNIKRDPPSDSDKESERPLGQTRWVNIWTRYDPAQAGPLTKDDEKLAAETEDIPASNEGDPFADHSSYWNNHDQVIPALVKEIWGPGACERFHLSENDEVSRLRRRKLRILLLAVFRLPVWLLFPASLLGFFYFTSNGTWDEKVTGWEYIPYNSGQAGLTWFPSWFFEWWTWAWGRWVTLGDGPFLRTLIDSPNWFEGLVAAFVFAMVVTSIARIVIYGFVKAVIWDAFVENLGIFQKRPVRSQPGTEGAAGLEN